MATTESADGDISTRLRHGALRFYYFLRSSLWRAIALLGVLFLVIGFLLDALELHGVFAGMFGLWGVSVVFAAVLGYLSFVAIRLYGRYADQPV